ncbi:hypothetical protein Bca52824_091553 [Brassica carinata]|uniref:Uncharacterized protein n=1 Tax=Brassica carinata TaxID=52824 RepID=A0A8X7TEY8_BRACI|nr:hypothetical protein Bca52824_091553 [Brassica carinata]
MQRDKAMKREALANPWYESFGFSLLETLINPDDSSIYGAVYMYKHYDSYQKTLFGETSALRDCVSRHDAKFSNLEVRYENVRCLLNILNQEKGLIMPNEQSKMCCPIPTSIQNLSGSRDTSGSRHSVGGREEHGKIWITPQDLCIQPAPLGFSCRRNY